MKRFVYILLAVVILASAVLVSGCNKTVADFTYKYNYTWIELPGGDVVEGPYNHGQISRTETRFK